MELCQSMSSCLIVGFKTTRINFLGSFPGRDITTICFDNFPSILKVNSAKFISYGSMMKINSSRFVSFGTE